jgi:hypothetical protein
LNATIEDQGCDLSVSAAARRRQGSPVKAVFRIFMPLARSVAECSSCNHLVGELLAHVLSNRNFAPNDDNRNNAPVVFLATCRQGGRSRPEAPIRQQAESRSASAMDGSSAIGGSQAMGISQALGR